MKSLFTTIFIFFTSIAVAAEGPYFAPGIINRVPTKEEQTPPNNIKSKEECISKGGEWFESQKYNYAYCVIPYADAGKLCKSSKDCIGHCTWPLNKKTLEGTPLEKGHGICQVNDAQDDCGRPHFENGEIIFFNCE